ncbi:MAG: DUF4065 domain-containing protein [Candidatus Parcubacteria bacterium]|nr:DUF4065 domain-containing protein [Candidatus Parcubacteria bacterium]
MLLFFVEADYFEKYGELISGISYIKNNYGPTPSYSETKKALDELKSGGYLIKNKENAYIAKNDLLLKYLDDKKLDAIRATCEKYYKLSVNDICLLAHKDPIYLGAEKNKILDFSFVRYRDEDKPDLEQNNFKNVKFSDDAQKKLLALIS